MAEKHDPIRRKAAETAQPRNPKPTKKVLITRSPINRLEKLDNPPLKNPPVIHKAKQRLNRLSIRACQSVQIAGNLRPELHPHLSKIRAVSQHQPVDPP